MREQRIVWRPNSFTPEEWDALSRDEQIQWYKDNKPKDRLPSNPQQAVEAYFEGALTDGEFQFRVFERVTEDNVQEFVEKCPPDVQIFLRQQTLDYPPDEDDEGWGQLRIIQSYCYSPWAEPTREEIQEAEKESIRLVRQGVRLFRSTRRAND